MKEFLLDLFLPPTDRIVAIQWAIAIPLWIAAVFGARNASRDVKHFVWGICMMNLAWFTIRAAH